MNVSEYKLIVSLVNKVKEPVIAIEIAKDALTLGRKIDTLKKNISYLQKNISNDQNFIKDMAAQWRDRLDEDMDLIQTKIYLELKIVRTKQKIQNYMEEYDFITPLRVEPNVGYPESVDKVLIDFGTANQSE